MIKEKLNTQSKQEVYGSCRFSILVFSTGNNGTSTEYENEKKTTFHFCPEHRKKIFHLFMRCKKKNCGPPSKQISLLRVTDRDYYYEIQMSSTSNNGLLGLLNLASNLFHVYLFKKRKNKNKKKNKKTFVPCRPFIACHPLVTKCRTGNSRVENLCPSMKYS